MENQSLTGNCARNFELREHCCFGISPFNSYFSEDRIRELARWGTREFKSIHFFIPDVPSVYTLEAQGYPREKAEWKARRQSQYLKNKIHRALISLSISDEAAQVQLVPDSGQSELPTSGVNFCLSNPFQTPLESACLRPSVVALRCNSVATARSSSVHAPDLERRARSGTPLVALS